MLPLCYHIVESWVLDFIFDWLVQLVPRWLAWLILTPLLVFLGLMLIEHLWPGSVLQSGG